MNEFQILVFLGLPGIGRITVKKIIDKKPPLNDNNNYEDYVQTIKDIVPNAAKKISLNDVMKSFSYANGILEECGKLKIIPVGYNNKLYPEQLKDLGKKSPVLIYAKGNLSLLKSTKNIAIIGTRNISIEGLKAGSYITKQFVNKGYTIVSGLAKGCDTVGHKVCLDNGGKTIAVLASGLDIVYPKDNIALAKRILKNGCLISEYPPNTEVMSNYFIERDRIQSGLSKGIVVIETNTKGGTMHTVKFGLEQGRKVACINYKEDLILPSNAGNRMLINDKTAFSLSSENIDQYIELLNQSNNLNDVIEQGTFEF
tara:strand:- start:821 stop:1759 length:939 start_codon:yes stop_codon:yes gene_type:complete